MPTTAQKQNAVDVTDQDNPQAPTDSVLGEVSANVVETTARVVGGFEKVLKTSAVKVPVKVGKHFTKISQSIFVQQQKN